MRRSGRTWYRFDADGRVIGVYADMDALGERMGRGERFPLPAVPGLGPVGAGAGARVSRDWTPPPPPGSGKYYDMYVDLMADEDPREALIKKVRVLADRGATEGERAAARAALVRLAAR